MKTSAPYPNPARMDVRLPLRLCNAWNPVCTLTSLTGTPVANGLFVVQETSPQCQRGFVVFQTAGLGAGSYTATVCSGVECQSYRILIVQ